MSRRILLAAQPTPVLAPLRRYLEDAGFEVDAVPPGQAAARAAAGAHVAAVVPVDAGGAALVGALRAADPRLPVLAVFPDAALAAGHPDGLGADGALVGPLSAPAVSGACRMAERLAAARRAAEAEAARAGGGSDLQLLKRLLPLEVKRSRRYGFPVALALVAVDRWPEVAERAGPGGGPAVLAQVLGVLAASVRDIDLAVPFAGDRLLVLMPHTRAEGALQVARRLCARVRERGGPLALTVSAGVAGHDGGGTVSFGGLVKRAAEALTRARAAGGDRAEPAAPPRRRDRIVIG